MRLRTVLCAALAGLCAASVTFSEEGTSAKEDKPISADIRLGDGSLVRTRLLDDTLDVMTKYGKLSIPFREIYRIDVGLHVMPEKQQEIVQAIAALGSAVYREREDATCLLADAGPVAYSFLKKVRTTTNPEATKRIEALLKRLETTFPREILLRKEVDVVHAKEFKMVGRILLPALKCYSMHLGNLALSPAELRTIHVRTTAAGTHDLAVNAATHGSEAGQWLETGLFVDEYSHLVVTAEGKVDLHPQLPGGYMSTPKGYTCVGKDSTFMAGSLIGRIGEKGKPFLISERYEETRREEGTLYLHIVPSPWNNASVGTYRVLVTIRHDGVVP